MRTGMRFEISEPNRHRHGPKSSESLPRETLKYIRSKSAGALENESGLERILGKCFLLANGF